MAVLARVLLRVSPCKAWPCRLGSPDGVGDTPKPERSIWVVSPATVPVGGGDPTPPTATLGAGGLGLIEGLGVGVGDGDGDGVGVGVGVGVGEGEGVGVGQGDSVPEFVMPWVELTKRIQNLSPSDCLAIDCPSPGAQIASENP